MFESYRLTGRSLAVYRALLQQPELLESSRLPDLADQLAMSQEELAEDLDKLRQLGFVAPNWSNLQEYPLDPAVAFEGLASRRRREIDDLSEELRADQLRVGKFVSDYGNFLVQKSARDVEILEGRERANQRMQHFQPAKSMWGLIPTDIFPRADFENSPDRRHLERGIEIRYLFPESFLKKSGAREFVQLILEFGGNVRITPSVPFRLIIIDNDVAVMGIDPDDSSVGAVVHHSKAVVRLAMEIYQQYWHAARAPFRAQADPKGISPQESEFLKLLVQGATDEQVGRRLGVSMRTVRRMAAKLSEQVGASGRSELGVRAAQRRWVD